VIILSKKKDDNSKQAKVRTFAIVNPDDQFTEEELKKIDEDVSDQMTW
jgi:hypothetical protein